MNAPIDPGRGPDRAAALDQYRQRASVYDLELMAFEPIRRQAIELLALQPGQVVLDVGCGTGLSLPLLRQAVGPQGRIVGIEQCPEMLARAQARVAQQGWKNITLLCAPVEAAPLKGQADAALFHFTHDILRRPEAVARVMAHLRPAAQVVASGLAWAPAWALPVNLFVWGAALRSVSSLDGLQQPWDLLAGHTGPLALQTTWLGAVYLASGQRKA